MARCDQNNVITTIRIVPLYCTPTREMWEFSLNAGNVNRKQQKGAFLFFTSELHMKMKSCIKG